MHPKLAIGHHVAPLRFLSFLVVSLAAALLLYGPLGWARAAMLGFDAGAAVFLASCLFLFGHEADAMRASAERNDANRALLLAITGAVCTAILIAIGYELSERAALDPDDIALVIGTLLLAWLFSNMIYTLHYAHLYYTQEMGGDARGLDFPGTEEPDYWDFVYFAFTLGMTFQTSDVGTTSRRIRRIVIIHCFAAFVFNIGVLAFTINVLGG